MKNGGETGIEMASLDNKKKSKKSETPPRLCLKVIERRNPVEIMSMFMLPITFVMSLVSVSHCDSTTSTPEQSTNGTNSTANASSIFNHSCLPGNDFNVGLFFAWNVVSATATFSFYLMKEFNKWKKEQDSQSNNENVYFSEFKSILVHIFNLHFIIDACELFKTPKEERTEDQNRRLEKPIRLAITSFEPFFANTIFPVLSQSIMSHFLKAWIALGSSEDLGKKTGISSLNGQHVNQHDSTVKVYVAWNLLVWSNIAAFIAMFLSAAVTSFSDKLTLPYDARSIHKGVLLEMFKSKDQDNKQRLAMFFIYAFGFFALMITPLLALDARQSSDKDDHNQERVVSAWYISIMMGIIQSLFIGIHYFLLSKITPGHEKNIGFGIEQTSLNVDVIETLEGKNPHQDSMIKVCMNILWFIVGISVRAEGLESAVIYGIMFVPHILSTSILYLMFQGNDSHNAYKSLKENPIKIYREFEVAIYRLKEILEKNLPYDDVINEIIQGLKPLKNLQANKPRKLDVESGAQTDKIIIVPRSIVDLSNNDKDILRSPVQCQEIIDFCNNVMEKISSHAGKDINIQFRSDDANESAKNVGTLQLRYKNWFASLKSNMAVTGLVGDASSGDDRGNHSVTPVATNV